MITVDDMISYANTVRDCDFDFTETLTSRLRSHIKPYIDCRVLSCKNFSRNRSKPEGYHALRSLETGKICDIFYMEDGNIHGPRITFCPITAKLFEIRHYIQGMIHGVTSRYGIDGNIISETLYIEGESMTEQLRQLGVTKFSSMTDTQRSHIKLALGIDL